MHLGWTADQRPVRQVVVIYARRQGLGGEEHACQDSSLRAALQAALQATGRTRAARVAATDRRVTVLMRIKADDEPAAIADAATLIDHAATRSGAGFLGDVAAIRVYGPGALAVG